MKKSVPILILLAALAAGTFWFVKRAGVAGGANLTGADLVPAELLVYAELPDLHGSARRWQGTALAQIQAEPEVRAFIEKPLADAKTKASANPALGPLAGLSVERAFAALVALDGPSPRFAGGFVFNGTEEELVEVIAPLRARVLEKYPAGKADLVDYKGETIETFEAEGFYLASVRSGRWYLISSGADLIEGMLDRLHKRGAPDAPAVLSGLDAYRTCAGKVGPEFESLLFVRPQPLVARLAMLATAAGRPLDDASLAEMRKVEAVAASTAFRGADMRDRLYVLAPGIKPAGALARSSMVFTNPGTLFYFAGLLDLPERINLPDTGMDSTGVIRMFSGILARLEARGLGMNELKTAIGPEFGIQLDWPPAAAQPSLLVSVGIRDKDVAARLVRELASGALGLPVMTEEKTGNATLHVLTGLGRLPVSPTLARTDDTLLLGLTPDHVRVAIEAGSKGERALEAAAAYRQAAGAVAEPSQGFAYLDTRALFERLYGTFRPFIVMGAAFLPRSRGGMDFSKLPATEVISRHLGPSVFSQVVDDNGVYAESIGPLTLNQAVLGAGAAAAILGFQKQFQALQGAAPQSPPPAPSAATPPPGP